jgi:DNA replication protein DnaC
MTSNTERCEQLGLPDDADATRLLVRQAAMKIRDRCTKPHEPSESGLQRKMPPGYEEADENKIQEKDAVLEYIRRVRDNRSWPLYIHGRPGVGKTSIAALMYSRCVGSALWLRADTFLKEVAFATTEELRTWRQKIRGTSCVFLDDLGVQAPTPQMLVALFDLLEDRKGKPLVITSNHNLQALSQIYETRIVSRLSAGATLWLDGNDQRRGQGDRLKIGGNR